MTERPPTCKARGICKYYDQPRGCFSGDKCKFLHCNPSKAEGQLTPFDRAKVCRYYAAGFCKREDKCWFLHVKPSVDEDEEYCSICFEKPYNYGLLSGCSHVFCTKCIRLWRNPSGKSEDVKCSGVTKRCPMCRTPSKFITPSSVFYKHGDPRKDQAMATYMASMARVPCRYFTQSKMKNPARPLCPFGKDCFYQHTSDDGSPFVFRDGVERSVRTYRLRQRDDGRDISSALEDILLGVTQLDRSLLTRDGLGLLTDMFTSFQAALEDDEEFETSESDDFSMPDLECLSSSDDEQKDDEDAAPFVTDGRGRVIAAGLDRHEPVT